MIIPSWKIIQTKKLDLVERQKQLEEAQTKNKLVDNLISVYDQKTSERNLIEEYIPTKVNDEEIINNLIYYANIQTGDKEIKISDISVAKPVANKGQTGKPPIPQIPADVDMENPIFPGGIVGRKMEIGTPLNTPVSFDADVSFVGKYQGLKEFFNKLKIFKRANSVSSFSILRSGTGSSEALTVKAKLSFNFLDKYNPVEVASSLLESSLDMSVAEKIKVNTNEVMKVIVDSKGRENPFLP